MRRHILTLALVVGLAVGAGVPATVTFSAVAGSEQVVPLDGGNEWG